MKQHRRWAFALVATSALATTPVTAAEGQASITEVGWWSVAPVNRTPEGGLAVGQTFQGSTSVAAVRITVAGAADKPESAVLTLTEAETVGAEQAVLRVCPADDDWEKASGGSMEDAPAPACDRGDVLLRRVLGGKWAGDVAALLTGPTNSLVILPAATGEPIPPTFELTFQPPALEATGAPPTTSSSTTTTVPRDDNVDAVPPPSFDFGSFPPISLPAPVEAFTPMTTPVDNGTTAMAPARAARVRMPTSDQGRNVRWGLLGLYALVAAFIGAAAGTSRHQLRIRGLLPTR
ncbi:MAG: hypothetical protein KY443_02950 [Actinobacteria bacterium]|nr:hypothetical protein [Actinomycetota bacterium]